jgi:hypothetical protein
MRSLGSTFALVALVACGGGGGGNTDAPAGHVDAPKSGDATHDDAPHSIDAPGSGSGSATVIKVDCGSGSDAPTVIVTASSSPDAYISTPAGSASNNSEITVNQVVEFNMVPAMTHPVGPNASAGMTDSGLRAGDGAVTCLQFTAPGTFHYHCTVHGFTGTVTVSQ